MPIRSLMLQALVLSYSLTAGAFHSNPPSLVNEPEGLVRLAIPVAAGMLGVALRDRGPRRHERPPNSLAVDLIVIYGLVIVSQVLLAFLMPHLSLPGWAPTQGGFVGCMLFTAARAVFAAPPAEEETTSRGNRHRKVYQIAASIALVLGTFGLFMTSVRGQIASALIVIGSIHLLWRTFAVHSAIRRSATAWYYFALLPASIIALSGSKVYLYWIPIVILMFAEANQRAAD